MHLRGILFWVAFTWAIMAPAGDLSPDTLRITQSIGLLPTITAYLDARTGEGAASPALDPSRLMATLGENPATVVDLKPFGETREGVAYLLLVDVSKSLSMERFEQMRMALQDWQASFEEQDRVALMTFGDSVQLLAPFTGDKSALKQQIDRLKPLDNSTALNQALTQAMEFLQNVGADFPNRRVVVILSDGINDAAGGVTREEVLERMKIDRIPIYAIGFASPPINAKKQAGLTELGVFARTSGGEYLAAGNQRFDALYADLRLHIRAVWRLQLACPECKGDGKVYRLQLNYKTQNQTLTDGLDIRLLPKLVAPGTSQIGKPTIEGGGGKPDYSTWVFMLFAVASVLSVFLYLLFRSQKKKTALAIVPPASSVKPSALSSLPASKPKALGWRVSLTEVNGYSPGKVYRANLEHEFIIGRTVQCGMVIDTDIEISSNHCRLKRQVQGLFIEDLNSTNGTLVNGVPITGRYLLQKGDLILLGRTELRILWDES